MRVSCIVQQAWPLPAPLHTVTVGARAEMCVAYAHLGVGPAARVAVLDRAQQVEERAQRGEPHDGVATTAQVEPLPQCPQYVDGDRELAFAAARRLLCIE